MTDHVTKARRSAIMSSIRGKNTTPELLVRKAAHGLGLRFRLHVAQLPGRPDLVLPKWKTVVFVNGCFWHQHAGCPKARIPKSNINFWRDKLRKNVRRDTANYARLRALGWRIIVLWQCEAQTPAQAATALTPKFRIKRGRNQRLAGPRQIGVRRSPRQRPGVCRRGRA
jgi:DNA mismatch endonuclease (patch repair protein)